MHVASAAVTNRKRADWPRTAFRLFRRAQLVLDALAKLGVPSPVESPQDLPEARVVIRRHRSVELVTVHPVRRHDNPAAGPRPKLRPAITSRPRTPRDRGGPAARAGKDRGRRRLRRRSSPGRAAQAKGPLLRPPGCCASRWRATALRAALDPGDLGGPWGQAERAGPGPAPGQARGAQARPGGRPGIPGRQRTTELAFDSQKKRKIRQIQGPGSRPGNLITAEPPSEAASHRTRCARNPGCSSRHSVRCRPGAGQCAGVMESLALCARWRAVCRSRKDPRRLGTGPPGPLPRSPLAPSGLSSTREWTTEPVAADAGVARLSRRARPVRR